MRPLCRLALLLLLGLLAWTSFLGSRSYLAGRVNDDRGPVARASVHFKGESGQVLTDPRGRFLLPLPSQNGARVTAWKMGYFIAGSPADSLPLVLKLDPLPGEDHEEYAWVDPVPDPGKPQNCGNCHPDIYREWSASGHARSANNRHFLNLYDGSDWQGRPNAGWNLLAERPDGVGVCNACHAPTAGFDLDLRPTAPKVKSQGPGPTQASQGVHCDFCHKVAEVDNDRIGLTHGRYGLKLLRPPEGQLFFGPLDDVDRHEDSFAQIYKESRYCASCHEGTVFGVPVYSTYSEWLASPAHREGKQCQTCHMAPTGTLSNLAPGKGGIHRDPYTLANHRFFAGSQADMLRQAVKVSAHLAVDGKEVCAEIEVRADGVGHRLPTGFVDRNLVLVVEGFDSKGQRVAPGRGPLLSPLAGPMLSGQAGRLYAKELKDFDGHSPVPFWRADPDAIDTRLVPGQADRIEVAFPPQVEQVTIRLLYRRFWPEVARVKGWPDNEITVLQQVITVSHSGG